MNQDYATIGMVVGGLLVVMQVANLAVTLWYRLRRQPPIDQTLRCYVLKQDFDAHCERNEKAIGQLFDLHRAQTADVAHQIQSLRDALGAWQLGMSQMLGNIEGRVAAIERDRKK